VTVAFHDDVSILAHSPAQAAACLQLIREVGPSVGLHMSPRKTLVWKAHPSQSNLPWDVPSAKHFRGLAQVHIDSGVELLGGSVTADPSFASKVAAKRAVKASDGIHRLLSFLGPDDPQLCLMLLRACLGMVKLVYCFRTTSPDQLHEASAVLHRTLYDALRYLHVGDPNNLRFGDFQLKLTSLPIKWGGLGIHLPGDLLPYCLLASRLDSLPLQAAVFPNLPDPIPELTPLLDGYCASLTPQFQQKFLSAYSLDKNLPLNNNQRTLADWFYRSKREKLLQHDFLKRRDLLEFSGRHRLILHSTAAACHDKGPQRQWVSLSSDWLMAIPNKSLRQSLTASQFRAALCFRSLIPFFKKAHPCRCGKEMMDIFGYHTLSCQGVENLTFARHELVVLALSDLAARHGYHARRNADVVCLGTTVRNYRKQQRPADLLVQGPLSDQCVDVTVVSPLSYKKSTTSQGTKIGQQLLDSAAAKFQKHQEACDNAGGLTFLPFAADVCGLLSTDAYGLLQSFAVRGEETCRRPYSELISVCRRRISLAIQMGVSNQFLINASFPAGKYSGADASCSSL
jgi:hypothetical protein